MTREARGIIGQFAGKIRRDYLGLPPSERIENLENIVTSIGGAIEYFDWGKDDKFEQVTKKDDGSFVITIDKTNTPQQQRFSIAHELGHLFVHMRYDTSKWRRQVKPGQNFRRQGLGVNQAVEDEANAFADAFLMPKDLFAEIIEKEGEFCNEDFYFIDKIADYFGVPQGAVLRRGRHLEKWD